MTNRETMELFIEKNGQETVAYPFVEKDHVVFGNGMGIEEVIEQDISMPTVTHEKVSFKVGVGDQDVSSSVVDSSVGEMVIKGQTYHNILPEPSTHVLSNNKKMFKVNEGLDANVNIVDGIAKYAVLSGQTLVNLVQQNNMYLLFGTSGQGKVNRTITTSGAIYETSVDNLNSYITVRTGAHTLLKPNTSYTIFFEVVQNTITKSGVDYKGVTVSGYNDSYYGRSGDRQLYHDGNFSLSKGLKKIVITTSSDVTSYDGLGFGFPSFNTNETPQGQVFEIQNVMVIEGDYSDQDIPYFTSMTNCKAPVLQTVGANLWSSCEKYTCESTNGQTIANDITKFSKIFIGKTIQNGLVFRAKVTKENLVQNTTYNSSYHFGLDICFYCSDGTTVWSDFTTSKLGSLADANGKTYTFFNSRLAGKTVVNVKHCSLFMRGLEGKFEMYDIEIFDCHENNVPAQYEAYKSNTVTTNNEVALRSSPNGVCDTLNLITGEYVQRIGEVVLNGSENWVVESKNSNVTSRFSLKVNDMLNENIHTVNDNNLNVSGVFPVLFRGLDDQEQIFSHNGAIHIRINDSKLNDANDTNSFKAYLQSNPITVQYKLATPIIKTVDLSSSRNWMELTLTGEEEWRDSGNTPYITPSVQPKKGVIPFSNGEFVGVDIAESFACFWLGGGTNTPNGNLVFYHPMVKNAIQMKEFLRNNPQKIYYYVEDGMGCIKQPIFFKDGHIIQSSGANNSLIPTLNYQAKTSNSYVMDLMKTNTKYTMKAKSASGTFTIDGTSYGAGTNGTFTTPSSMTNKLLVMSNKTNEEVMILEGDVVSKTIPYFKGIKSAFEDESQIEVLSQGKNWVNLDNARLNSNHQKVVTRIENGFNIKFTYKGENFAGWDNAIKIKVNVKRNTDYTVSLTKIVRKDPYGGMSPQPTWVTGYTWVRKGDSSNESFTERNLLDGVPTTMKFNSRDYDYVTLDICSTPSTPVQDGDFDIVDIQIEESSSATVYESYKSNSTKIPLLSPLRSLPNGVCDELIIDRMKKKATLIQRVGQQMYDGTNGNWITEYKDNPILNVYDGHSSGKNKYGDTALVCNRFLPKTSNGRLNTEKYLLTPTGMSHFKFWVDTTLIINQWQKQLSQNPVVIYYQMETPVVTEIDLEGFPYVYKDGHIFLNSEIAPTTQITYSISQQHQIDASTQDLIRHEQEIDYLYKLIAQYIQVDYQSTLLSLDLKLK